MDYLQISQRVGPSDYGCDPYQVVVSTANGELVHEYCLYSSAYGGPVRPGAVTGLRAEPTGGGRATMRSRSSRRRSRQSLAVSETFAVNNCGTGDLYHPPPPPDA